MKYRFSRTNDKKFIRHCMTSPEVWRMNNAIAGIDRDFFFVSNDWPFYYLKVDPDYGLLIGEPKDDKAYEFHVALLPKAKGQAVDICKNAVQWFFDNTEYNTITASVPSFNALAGRLADKIGMINVGIKHNAFQCNGKIYDSRLYEIRR